MSPSQHLSAVQLTRELFPSRPLQLFTVTTVSLDGLHEDALRVFLASRTSKFLGIAVLSKTQRRLSSVVVATASAVLHITGIENKTGLATQRRLLEQYLFCNEQLRMVGPHLDVVAYGLYTDARVMFCNGVDLQSILPKHEASARDALQVFLDLVGSEHAVHRPKLAAVFCAHTSSGDEATKAMVRARESCVMAHGRSTSELINDAPLVSTRRLQAKILLVSSKIHRDSLRVDAMKPHVQTNDVGKDMKERKGKIFLQSARYKTRLRETSTQKVIVTSSTGKSVHGRVTKVRGKQAEITAVAGGAPLRDSRVKSVTTIGKDPLTNAEKSKEQILLHLLQGKACVKENAAFGAIWMPGPSVKRGPAVALPSSVTIRLNASQDLAVRSVIAAPLVNAVSVVLVRGPPGTGKTTMITASVQALRGFGEPVWLVAHSNVAVKNIAEKLAKEGFWGFKVLVANEFHFDWHEHLYERMQAQVMTSAEFPKTRLGVDRALLGARVLLCTLSMLSNSRLAECGFTSVVPVETVIVDEASQIELGDYLSPAKLFARTLRRLVFVGDDKQLAPFGQDDIKSLQSIFEVQRHSAGAVLLNTCYRLPRPICNFISKHVYSGKLLSQHDITTRSSCRFVDVQGGIEKKAETSWQNEQEANACIALAAQLCKIGRSEFRIITPYDAQRALIETKLKSSPGIPWKDRVFCVDSFQGNEAPYIIISVVRTTKPGFMTNMRRTNVMLTRCQRGMYVCASRTFLASKAAQQTLVGKMAKEWGAEGWVTVQDVLNGRL